MNSAVISVGANLSPQANIQKAQEIIQKAHSLLAISTFQQTKPVDLPPQPDFLNGAWLVETHLSYEDFNHYLKDVERQLGRIHQEKQAPRTIDLDIVVWREKVVHRDFYARDFVRNAVLEVCPDLEWEH